MAQISNIESTSGMGSEALALILQNSPVMAMLETANAFELDTDAFEFYTPDDSLTLQSRAKGEAYDAEFKQMGSRQSASQKYNGFKFVIDASDIADMKLGKTADYWKKDLQRMIKTFATAYDVNAFQGAGTGSAFKGLSTILNGSTNMPGYGVTGVIDAASGISGTPNSLDLTSSSNWMYFLEKIDAWIAEVQNPTALIMNLSMRSRLISICHEKRNITTTLDAFNQPLTNYNGIPIYVMKDETILKTEADNAAAAVTTSIYVASPGEMNFSFVTNSGLEWREPDAEPQEGSIYKGEIRGAWKIEDKNAVRRIRNIKI